MCCIVIKFPQITIAYFHSKTELRTDSGSLTLPHKSLQHLVQCCRHKRYSEVKLFDDDDLWSLKTLTWTTSLKKSKTGSVHPDTLSPESRLIWVKVISQKYYQIMSSYNVLLKT